MLAIRTALLLSALPLLATPAAAQGKLWIVSDSGCPKVDFATIQEAVDAAAEGDVILVRAKRSDAGYGDFTIDGKSLTVTGDGRHAPAIEGTVSIRNLLGPQTATVRGFTIRQFPLTSGMQFDLRNNLGTTWIEDCAMTGAVLHRSKSAVFARCDGSRTATGGTGITLSGGSNAYLYDCRILGEGWEITGGSAKPGADVPAGSRLFASGSTITGGWGRPGGGSSTGPCTGGGRGGPALRLGGTAHLLDTALIGGTGGPGLSIFYGTCYGPQGRATTGRGRLNVHPRRCAHADHPRPDPREPGGGTRLQRAERRHGFRGALAGRATGPRSGPTRSLCRTTTSHPHREA